MGTNRRCCRLTRAVAAGQREKIGLRAFLHNCRVPGYPTPICACATGKETAEHVILYCRNLINERRQLQISLAPRLLEARDDLAAATSDPKNARLIAQWLIAVGRLPMYNLAASIGGSREQLRRPVRSGDDRGRLIEAAQEGIEALGEYLARQGVG